MKQYSVSGMSCAACSAAVEKAVGAVDGVQSCAVSLLTNSMRVEGTADSAAVIAAVQKAGYDAALKTESTQGTQNTFLEDRETPRIAKRLAASLVFLALLLYVSMGHGMLGLPLPAFLDGNFLALGLLQMFLAVAVMLINRKFFLSGAKSALHRAPNMDTLVALGSGTSFLWSAAMLFRMSGGNAAYYYHRLYFESAAMILALITVGKLLEAKSKGKTTDALKSLMRLKPVEATVLRGGKEVRIPIAQLAVGDVFAVRAGERIPADGIVRAGSGAADESALTGESMPADKTPGSPVHAATVLRAGYLQCEAQKVGEDTTLAQIIKTVSDAAATKAPIAKIADKVSAVFVPAVIGIAALTFAAWFIAGKDFSFTLARAVSVLVISCPCALGLATPVAITVSGGLAAKNGILFKTAESLEQAGKIQIAVFDKTGTVTTGTAVVTDIVPAPGISEKELLQAAFSLEQKSEHPLAQSVCRKALACGISAEEPEQFQTHAGSGVECVLEGSRLFGGNSAFLKANGISDSAIETLGAAPAVQGKTPLFFARDARFIGMIAVQDTAKAEAKETIRALKKMGIASILLTGDNPATAGAIAKAVGFEKVIAGVLPHQKAQVIRTLKKSGITAMIGDGINDAPALTEADLGIAVGAGTDVAMDAANIVLMKSSLSDVCAAVRIGRKTVRTIRQNLFWAFFYNAICIPVAAGALIAPFGIVLTPMMGAAAMSLSSFFVVMNALRTNLFAPHSAKHDKAKKMIQITKISLEGEKQMIIQVEGMMCPHCEARVKAALEAVEGVQSALPSHQTGEVELEVIGADVEKIALAVNEAGYRFIGVK